MSSLARNVKLSTSEEHMRRNLRARLNGMARFVCRGCHDDCRRYWCLSVGLVQRSVSTLPNWSSETLTSRKEVDIGEWDEVNLIVG